MNHPAPTPATLGLRSKSGRAVLVALEGPLEAPRFLLRRELALGTPDTFQPFHRVMELPWEGAVLAAAQTQSLIEELAVARLQAVIEELAKLGHPVLTLGVVGSPDRDLLRIGSRHIRSHAAEGLLYRRVLEGAAERNRVRSQTYSDRDTETFACEALARTPPQLKELLQSLGRAAGPPWRADERLAALAALMARQSIETRGF